MSAPTSKVELYAAILRDFRTGPTTYDCRGECRWHVDQAWLRKVTVRCVCDGVASDVTSLVLRTVSAVVRNPHQAPAS